MMGLLVDGVGERVCRGEGRSEGVVKMEVGAGVRRVWRVDI